MIVFLRFIIRDCTVKDISGVVAIENVSFDDPYPESLFVSFLNKFRSGFRVADSNGILVGYSIILPSAERHTAVITSLAVRPDFKRTKIGTRLLEDAISIAEMIEAPSITLQVAVNNIAAQALYSKFGFVKIRIIKDYYRNGLDGIEMKLLLEMP